MPRCGRPANRPRPRPGRPAGAVGARTAAPPAVPPGTRGRVFAVPAPRARQCHAGSLPKTAAAAHPPAGPAARPAPSPARPPVPVPPPRHPSWPARCVHALPPAVRAAPLVSARSGQRCRPPHAPHRWRTRRHTARPCSASPATRPPAPPAPPTRWSAHRPHTPAACAHGRATRQREATAAQTAGSAAAPWCPLRGPGAETPPC